MLKKPTTQTAQLVPTWLDLLFTGTKAYAEKAKKPVPYF